LFSDFLVEGDIHGSIKGYIKGAYVKFIMRKN